MNNFSKLIENTQSNGPTRVLISNDGAAVSPSRARRDYGIEPDIIFIRNDGWSLGAARELVWTAYDLWKKQWVGYIRLGHNNDPGNVFKIHDLSGLAGPWAPRKRVLHRK